MTIRVEGLAKLTRDLQKIGVDVNDLKDGMAKLADMGSQAAVANVPKRSGALAGSIRGNRAKAKAVVAAGRGKTSLYAGPMNYGWARRGIPGTHFMQRADAMVMPKIVPILSADIDRLIAERGLS